MCLSNAASSSAVEWPVKSNFLQLPQVGALASWSARTRLVVWQCGQTMCRGAVDVVIVCNWWFGDSFSSSARCLGVKPTAPNLGLNLGSNLGSNLGFQGRLLPHKLHEHFGNVGQAAVLSPDYAPVPLDG